MYACLWSRGEQQLSRNGLLGKDAIVLRTEPGQTIYVDAQALKIPIRKHQIFFEPFGFFDNEAVLKLVERVHFKIQRYTIKQTCFDGLR